MITYTELLGIDGKVDPNRIQMNNNGVISTVPKDEGNKDWQAYKAWLAKGNKPTKAKV